MIDDWRVIKEFTCIIVLQALKDYKRAEREHNDEEKKVILEYLRSKRFRELESAVLKIDGNFIAKKLESGGVHSIPYKVRLIRKEKRK